MLVASLLAVAAILPFAYAGGVVQHVLQAHAGAVPDALSVETVTPTSLDALTTAQYATLRHSAFPHHQVRIKKSDFCDGSVRAYTGYIDIQARHLFFYFFESRNDPDKDDVIFWTNGGPGCSSAMGLFMELGPCRVTGSNSTEFNPYAWNEHANVFFIDQPVGVGFSYAEYGEFVATTEEAAKDVAAFVAIFFEHFASFKDRAFHMAGESYGGRYVPVFASEVYDQNSRLKELGMTPVNLTSVMIGNGCSDDLSMSLSYYDMMCTPKSVAPILDIKACVGIKLGIGRCEKWVTEACRDSYDYINCGAAFSFCNSLLFDPIWNSGYNPYDISKLCGGPVDDDLCYPITRNISAYLDQPHVRTTIGVDSTIGNFSSCSNKVAEAFTKTQDTVFPTQYYLSALLERGVRVLIYVGENDWICNWVGNERMTLALEWSGKDAFGAQLLRDWQVDDAAAGVTRSAGPLTFATIHGAGHMAPYDKPKESLELLARWLKGQEL